MIQTFSNLLVWIIYIMLIELTINLLVVKVNKCLLEYFKLLSSPVIFPLNTKISYKYLSKLLCSFLNITLNTQMSVLSCANAITSIIYSKSLPLSHFICVFFFCFNSIKITLVCLSVYTYYV